MYVVKPGDYLKGIATKLHVALTDLLQINKITVNSAIFPGDKLTVPAGGVLPASATAPANSPASATSTATRTGASTSTTPQTPASTSSYVVQNGDYLFGIATNHGVTVPALLAANKLTVHSVILPGFTLSIPPATLPIPASATTPTVVPTPAQGSAGTQTGTQAGASIATVLAFLQAQLGKPYVFNTAGPDTYDCSGLVTAAYLHIGISLPHQSLLQSTKGTVVDFHNAPILAGDLIFQYSSAKPDVISHVGIAISATQWVQAARTGDFVKISPMPSFDRIVTVRRIVPAAA